MSDAHRSKSAVDERRRQFLAKAGKAAGAAAVASVALGAAAKPREAQAGYRRHGGFGGGHRRGRGRGHDRFDD